MSTPERLPDISSRAWEHPADRAALEALRAVPGFELVFRKGVSLFSERPIRVITQGSAVEVGPQQHGKLNQLYEQILDTLDAPHRYDLFVSRAPMLTEGAIGMDDPFVVLTASAVEAMSEPQLRAHLAAEVGHILSGHVLYRTVLRLLTGRGSLLGRMPLTRLALTAVMGAMLEWDRKSALSADRASLLATQDPDGVRSLLLRRAGGIGADVNIEAFRGQAHRYEERRGTMDSLLKTLTLLNRTQPFPVLRMREVDRWLESGAYDRVLGGDYPRRSDDPDDPPAAFWSEAMGSYAEGAREAAEPVGRWFKAAGEGARDAAGAAWSWMRRDEASGAGSGEDHATGDDPPGTETPGGGANPADPEADPRSDGAR